MDHCRAIIQYSIVQRFSRALHDRQCLFADRDPALVEPYRSRSPRSCRARAPARVLVSRSLQAARNTLIPLSDPLLAGLRHWPAADPPFQSPTRCRFPTPFCNAGPPRAVLLPASVGFQAREAASEPLAT